MHCWIEIEKFFAFRAAMTPKVSEDEMFEALFDAGLVRVEGRDGVLRARCSIAEAEVPARIERPGVFFISLREFIGASTNPGYLDEPEGDFEIEATPERVDTSYWPMLHGDDDFAYFPDPASAPETWTYMPDPEDADFADAD